MKYRVGDTVVISQDVFPGMHYTFRYSTGYTYSYMITGGETWATPGAIVTIEAVLCVGANGALMYRARGNDNLMSEMIDHFATAERKRVNTMARFSRKRDFIANQYIVITKSNVNSVGFSSNHIYQVRQDYNYLRVYKDNTGLQNGTALVKLTDTRPASPEEVRAYKINRGPCQVLRESNGFSQIGMSNRDINQRKELPMHPYIGTSPRGTSIMDYATQATDSQISTSKKLHQKAQVFKKRAKTKRKLIIIK